MRFHPLISYLLAGIVLVLTGIIGSDAALASCSTFSYDTPDEMVLGTPSSCPEQLQHLYRVWVPTLQKMGHKPITIAI